MTWQRSRCHTAVGHADQAQGTHMSRDLRLTFVRSLALSFVFLAALFYRFAFRYGDWNKNPVAIIFPQLDLRVDMISRNWLLADLSSSSLTVIFHCSCHFSRPQNCVVTLFGSHKPAFKLHSCAFFFARNWRAVLVHCVARTLFAECHVVT